MRSVVITGVSSGIGHAAAQRLLDRGFRVFGSVRRQADADQLKADFGTNFTAQNFDVTNETAVRAAAEEVRMALKGETLSGLVNNAGIAVSGPALELPVARFRHQMDVNLVGPVIVTQAFAPLLGTDRSLQGSPGRIVMISSVAGRSGNPLMAPYAASKHALEGLSESLRRELLMFGIDVILIGPGAVRTPIWEKTEEADFSAFERSPYQPSLQRMKTIVQHLAVNGMAPERIAGVIHHALTAAHPRTRYAVVANPVRSLIQRMLPKRLVDRVMARRLGLRPTSRR